MDTKIYRSPIGCLITPYHKGRCRALEKETSSYDKVYHKYIESTGFIVPYKGTNTFVTYNRDYDDLKRKFPNASIIERPVLRFDLFENQIYFNPAITLKPAQTEIIEKVKATFDRSCWYVNLQTGEGKTMLATYLSCYIGMKTWIVCFMDDILDQWINTFIANTSIDPSRIVRVNTQFLNGILAEKIDASDYDVFVSTPGLLTSFGKGRSDFSRIEDALTKCGIGLLICDEAHRNLANTIKINAVANIKYQLYLSADYGQGNYYMDKTYKIIFRNAVLLTPSEQTQDKLKHTELVVVEYNSYPTTIEKESIYNRYGYSASLFMSYEIKKNIILDCLVYTIRKTHHKDMIGKYKTLVLFTNIEHILTAYDRLISEFPDMKISKYYASLPDEEKEEADNADIIIATYGSFGTGKDVDNIKFIHSTNQCNKIQDNQAAGRSRPLSDGSSSLYFMYIDTGIPYCKRKLPIRLNYLQKTKAKSGCAYKFVYHPDVHKGEEYE